jgi:hypothetical protein
VRECELCEAAPLTTRFHEDEVCWVAECESCWVPMVVWNEHGTEPTDETVAHMLERLSEVAERVGLGASGEGWFVDSRPRSIPDHWHAHARRRYRA